MRNDGTYELVDGQQCLTTIFIIQRYRAGMALDLIYGDIGRGTVSRDASPYVLVERI